MKFSSSLEHWERQEIILWIGEYGWTREDLAKLGCYSFGAAKKVTKLCRRLGISSPYHLKNTPWFDFMEVKNVGERSVRVISHIIRYLHGDIVLDGWLNKR